MHFWWHYYAWHFGGRPSSRLRRFSCRSCRFEVFLGVLATQNLDEMFPQFPRPSCFGVKTRLLPKRKLKTKSSGCWIPIMFQGGLDVIFLAVAIFSARKKLLNGSQGSWILKFVTSDSPKTWLYYRPKRRPLLNFAVPHRHTAVDGWWSSKILTTWHLQKWMIDDERGLQWCTVCYHYFRPLFIAIILGKFHRDHSRAVGKFPQMSFYNSGWEIRVISHTVGGSYL